jgi:hypothetical protein
MPGSHGVDDLVCEEMWIGDGVPDPGDRQDDETHVSLWGGFDPPPDWPEYLGESCIRTWRRRGAG